MSYNKVLRHLWGHLLCAIDTETTGLDFEQHEIVQIAVLPLNGKYEPHPDVSPFQMLIKPVYPDNIEETYKRKNLGFFANAILNGIDSYLAGDLFIEWFEKLGLPEGKKLCPLAHNWPFDRAFIQKWLGPLNFNHMFDFHTRDSMMSAIEFNDMLDIANKPPLFGQYSLNKVASALGLEYERPSYHDAMFDASVCAQVYKELLNKKVALTI